MCETRTGSGPRKILIIRKLLLEFFHELYHKHVLNKMSGKHVLIIAINNYTLS
jgi:hypothetical protein